MSLNPFTYRRRQREAELARQQQIRIDIQVADEQLRAALDRLRQPHLLYQNDYFNYYPTRYDPPVDPVKAGKTAATLLKRYLSPDQALTWKESKQIFVDGQHNRYKIDRHGTVSGVRPEGSFCIALKDRYLPDADRVLGMKLYLETDEAGFLEEANWSDGRSSLVKLRIDGSVDRARVYGGNYRQPYFFFNAENQRLFRQQEPVTVTYNYVDATTFGDVNRTYLVGTTEWTNDTLTDLTFTYEET